MPENQHDAITDPTDDPWHEANVRVAGDADIGVEKVMTSVPVRRPNRKEFIRVHPDPGYRMDTLTIEAGEDNEVYIVVGEAREIIGDEARRVRLFTCINRRGTVFLWPAKLPREDNDRGRRWAETALLAADEGQRLWVKIRGNKDLGGYEYFKAHGDLGDPQWPDKRFKELLRLAFQDRRVEYADHPVIKQLNGEM